MNKRCNVCGGEFPVDTDHFYRDKSRDDGFSYRCITCHKDMVRRQRESNLDWVRKRSRERNHGYRLAHPELARQMYRNRRRKIAAMLQHLRSTLRCECCGSTDDLHFHHRVPAEKSFAIGDCTYSWDSMLEEMKKCDVLCRTCHIREHVRMRREAQREERAS